jgi:hypothetical protein
MRPTKNTVFASGKRIGRPQKSAKGRMVWVPSEMLPTIAPLLTHHKSKKGYSNERLSSTESRGTQSSVA